jgi:predicted acyltransferase
MRLISLDVFRGITIAAMILANMAGVTDDVYRPLSHAEWHGCTPTDLIFPWFLFIVGVAMTFSLSKYTTGDCYSVYIRFSLKWFLESRRLDF